MATPILTSRLPDDTVREALSFIAQNLRPDDLREIQATLDGDPEEIIKAAAAHSTKAWIVTDRTGLPFAVTGVVPGLLPGVGTPWMVSTPGIETEGLSFARQSRDVVAQAMEGYDVLTNFVDFRNDLAIDWLLFSGFHFVDAVPNYGVERRLFLQFSRTA